MGLNIQKLTLVFRPRYGGVLILRGRTKSENEQRGEERDEDGNEVEGHHEQSDDGSNSSSDNEENTHQIVIRRCGVDSGRDEAR